MEVDEGLVSFDAISLFPSKPIDLAKELVTQLLLENPFHIPSEGILEMLNYCLGNFYNLVRRDAIQKSDCGAEHAFHYRTGMSALLSLLS